MDIESEWMDEEETATWLRLPIEVVRAAIRNGDLPALRLGPHIRVSRVAARELALSAGQDARSGARPAPVQAGSPGSVPLTHASVWLEPLVPSTPFGHSWPRKGGGSVEEHYHTAWEGAIRLHELRLSVRVGQHTRDGHERLSVLLGETPICEFAETTDDRSLGKRGEAG